MSDGMTGDEDEPINEYRIKITVRNNLILNAIEAAGYKNVSEFCRAISISKTALTELIAMRRPPLNLDGEFSAHAKALMEGLCALPTDLWTSEQLTLRLKRNSAERDVSADGMRAALGMNAEETLELMKSDDLEETVLKQEMVTVIEEQLDSLGPRESKVLRLRFGIDCEEQTLEQIADTFDLTKERIRQIEAKALRKLKHPKRVIELRKLLPIYEITSDQKTTVVQPFCEHKNHQFYMNQNCVSVCAHCGIRETVWDKRYE